MNLLQSLVEDFHHKFGHPVRDTPTTIEESEFDLGYALIAEELAELDSASYVEACACGEECGSGDVEYAPCLVEIADAIGDVLWTTIGMAVRHGIDVERLMLEIARSNDSKLGADGKPVYHPNGKIAKGPNFQPPNIEAVLAPPF